MAKHSQTLGNSRVPQGVGWCRGKNRNDEGWWGFLYLKTKKLQIFKVSKSQNCKVPIFESTKFQSSKVSKIRNSISCFSEDIDLILAKSHFMFSGTYWSHFHYVRNIRRIFKICRAPSFRTFSKSSISENVRFPKVIFSTFRLWSSWIFKESWYLQS